jgi:TorA maturation chaperone TorD
LEIGAMLAGRRVSEGILPEDKLRAHHYRLLARFLAAPPDASLLELASGFEGDASDYGQGLAVLAARAREVTPAAAAREYQELFIGIGRGELLPYASYYLTGFLNERPLAKLRGDMGRLGIARADEVKEPEDHIAALCEMMAGLITGAFGAPLALREQHAFFHAHLAPWAGHFFEDLETAEAARLYVPIGTLGRLFVGIETTALEMEA